MIIVIDGIPVPQKRVRFSKLGGFGRIYDPSQNDKKQVICQLNRWATTHTQPYEKYPHIRVSFAFLMPIPASTPKKLLPLYESGTLKHEKKPDVDNLIKLYLDCMDGIIFDADEIVSLGSSVKLYHPEPKTIIKIDRTDSVLEAFEIDQDLWTYLFSVAS